LEDDHHDDVGGDKESVTFTSSQLYMDGQLTQEQLHSHPVGCISNDFDVREFEREEQEQADDDDDDDDDNDDDDRAAHATPVHATTSNVPLLVLHAMPT
jgi:hypothetical protein